ncbi:hypothetical protein [Pseudomonas sp. microsymbiont 2]
MKNSKYCVFCGNPPNSKNREHILPQWLLSLTGDPKRKVTMGRNHKTGRIISYDWSSLVVPACESCNNEFSKTEAQVRPLIERILQRESLTTIEYSLILDWLDKVRVGLWLNYKMIQGSIVAGDPSFHINSRIGRKDRVLAIYPFSPQQGLNAFGVNTLAFDQAPSAFALRINDLLILNCSSEYLVSARCGLPYPKSMTLHLDGESTGLLELSELNYTKKLKYPAFRFPIFKPSILLLQPIMQSHNNNNKPTELIGHSLMSEHELEESRLAGNKTGVGKIFKQHNGALTKLQPEEKVEFESISGPECKSFGDIVAQVYEIQIWLRTLVKHTGHKENIVKWKSLDKLIKQEAKLYINEHRTSK